MKVFLITAVLSAFAVNATAQNVYSDQFQTIKSIELIEITQHNDGSESERVVMTKKVNNFLDTFKKAEDTQKSNVAGVIMMTKELIALGKEIYAIVEAGKPVVTMESNPIHILPRNNGSTTMDGMHLQGWSMPKAKKFRYEVKNYMNIKPVVIEFMLIFSHGGNQDGVGKYISGAQVKPTYVDVKWGYKLDVNYKVQSIMNQGSSANPVAAAVLMFDFNIKTVLQDRSVNETFFINGNGNVAVY